MAIIAATNEQDLDLLESATANVDTRSLLVPLVTLTDALLIALAERDGIEPAALLQRIALGAARKDLL